MNLPYISWRCLGQAYHIDFHPIAGQFAEPGALIKSIYYGTAQQPILGGSELAGSFQ